MTVDPRFERSVRLWLRAYPRRWRLRRGRRAGRAAGRPRRPGSDARLDARTAAGLVRAGLGDAGADPAAAAARARVPAVRPSRPGPVPRVGPDDLEGASAPLRVLSQRGRRGRPCCRC